MSTSRVRPIAVSGVAATGDLHLGNYIGAISQWVALQRDYDCYLFVADLHALTVPEEVDPEDLARECFTLAVLYLAAGVDPARTVMFNQSRVAAHAELSWMLSCVTPMGWLRRMTQFKTRSATRDTLATGVLTYPVLQAADILLYDAHVVPVGDDQVQHIEVARDIAQRFNSLFGETFRPPAPMLRDDGRSRIMGLDDPSAKMSKSTAKHVSGHALGLLDPPEVIRRKIMRAVTDSGTEVDPDNPSPGIRNLMAILSAVTELDPDDTWSEFAGVKYGILKAAVADAVVDFLAPLQSRYQRLSADRAYVTGILEEGARRASAVADRKRDDAYRAVGIRN